MVEVAIVEAIEPERKLEREVELLREAERFMGRLLVPAINVRRPASPS